MDGDHKPEGVGYTVRFIAVCVTILLAFGIFMWAMQQATIAESTSCTCAVEAQQ